MVRRFPNPLVWVLLVGSGVLPLPPGAPHAVAQCRSSPPRGYPHPRIVARSEPAFVAQRFCLRRGRGELWTTSPAGDATMRWELRAGPTPEAALAAPPMRVVVDREDPAPEEQSFWRELSWRFRCPRDGLFYAATAIAPDGTAMPPAIVAAGSVARWGVSDHPTRRMTADVRFPVPLATLGLPGADVAIAVREGWFGPPVGPEHVYWDAALPASWLEGGARRLVFRDRSGALANGLTRVEFRGGKRVQLRIRARPDRIVPSETPLRLVLRIGARELDLGGAYFPHADE